MDRTTITVGDPITYSLTVRRGEADRVSFPEIREAIGELEVRDVQKEELRKVDGGGVEEAAQYILTSYVVGAIEIPALSITFVTASGDTGEARTHSIPITVQSVIEEGDEKVLKDVKPPVELAGGLPWWIWTLIGLSLIGIAIYLIHRRRARRSGARGVQKAPPRPIDELGEFDKIAALGLLEQGAFKRHYILVSDAMRRYIERRYALEAMERTTWEILSEMNNSRMDTVTVAKFEGFLSNCDLVKFAKLIPRRMRWRGSSTGRRMLSGKRCVFLREMQQSRWSRTDRDSLSLIQYYVSPQRSPLSYPPTRHPGPGLSLHQKGSQKEGEPPIPRRPGPQTDPALPYR